MRRASVAVAALLSAGLLFGCAPNGASAPETPLPETSSPTPNPSPTPTASPAEQAVAEMSTEEQAASVVMGTVATTDTTTLHDYMAHGYGGFILMSENVPATADELRAVTSSLVVDEAMPPLIAIDQEGGVVSRLPWDDAATAQTLQSSPASEAQSAFDRRGELVAEAGANVNFGIVADVPADTASFIAPRALGTDPASAAERVAGAVEGETSHVYSTLKHFPGHGAAPGDSHQSIPSTTLSLDDWHEADAVPFEAGIDAGAELLMFGHLAYTSVDETPASLSARWHEIARDELGFDGVMITDDLGMLASSGDAAYADPVANAVAAIAAGNDMVLMIATSTPDTAGAIADGIAQAVEAGELPADRLRDAAEHVAALRLDAAE
ncbi:glycoside hydrolase family 3 N-terminal domain-containing protein [Microbacterium halotolerans]|uniref:glycoside hydrolase family 3 N-terminal domain-containing protein n=1 Tax=Microbacterium halotolerans TaxID=246613 RepID=UPI001F0990FE|nr:glycoside hydrolase family 3 N-terminal domain-containing protein [Microbacterium halotolerans]